MNKVQFRESLKGRVTVLDGAMGTMLQAAGVPEGACPEQWLLDHPQQLLQMQQLYVDAGAMILYTPTFGANRAKLSHYGLAERTVTLNQQLAEYTAAAAAGRALVAGNMSASGLQVQPWGKTPFAEAVAGFKEQIQGLLAGGVDLFVIETMLDIQEARAALLAVKESCDLPVMVSMTFNENGRTMTGSDPLSCLNVLQSLGADVVGCNCSTGPEAMLPILAAMKEYAKVPLLVKPNAGVPRLSHGRTVFPMEAPEFAGFTEALVEAGANLIGGCCGTTPAYIERIAPIALSSVPKEPREDQRPLLSSYGQTVDLRSADSTVLVGERINPTGKAALQQQLQKGELQLVRQLALEQKDAGAAILDVNVGMAGIDERQTMCRAVETLASLNIPLCLDSSDPDVIEAALRIYPGRALVNSVPGERDKQRRLLQLCHHYGAMAILLPVSDEGVPAGVDQRRRNIQLLVDAARTAGLTKDDVVVDSLVMTVSANQEEAQAVLSTVAWCSQELQVATIMGLSNVSFGLPMRKWINAAFLAMAVHQGLSMVIANPSDEVTMAVRAASDVLIGRDQGSRRYLKRFRPGKGALPDAGSPQVDVNSLTALRTKLEAAVLSGSGHDVPTIIKRALELGGSPQLLLQETLIPAITNVGERFDDGTYFLPQLIQSAETMEKAVAHLQPHLAKEPRALDGHQAVIVMATVKGDIHDIGKNLVSLLLRNHGHKVIDLGKNVEASTIVRTAAAQGAHFIGLSALMTTTMPEMGVVVDMAAQQCPATKVIIGGAAVSAAYADEIGAHGYAADASGAVRLVKKLMPREGRR